MNVSSDTLEFAAIAGGSSIGTTSAGSGTVAMAVTDIPTTAQLSPVRAVLAHLL
jgi:hypothetical protein